MKKIKYMLGLTGLLVTLTLSMVLPKSAGATTDPDKVTICHATNAQTNPYTTNTVDKSSVNEPNNKYFNGHGDHTGPVWYPGIPNHSWGDIIPAFTFGPINYPGQNLTAEGQAFLDNECNYRSNNQDSVIVFDVVCDKLEGKDIVKVTFKNFGGSEGIALLNGEEVEIDSGETVVKYVELGVNVEIVIDETTVYNQTPDCVEEVTETPGQVLGTTTTTTQVAAPVSGVKAGAGGADAASIASLLGLGGSLGATSLGLAVRKRKK